MQDSIPQKLMTILYAEECPTKINDDTLCRIYSIPQKLLMIYAGLYLTKINDDTLCRIVSHILYAGQYPTKGSYDAFPQVKN